MSLSSNEMRYLDFPDSDGMHFTEKSSYVPADTYTILGSFVKMGTDIKSECGSSTRHDFNDIGSASNPSWASMEGITLLDDPNCDRCFFVEPYDPYTHSIDYLNRGSYIIIKQGHIASPQAVQDQPTIDGMNYFRFDSKYSDLCNGYCSFTDPDEPTKSVTYCAEDREGCKSYPYFHDLDPDEQENYSYYDDDDLISEVLSAKYKITSVQCGLTVDESYNNQAHRYSREIIMVIAAALLLM